MTRLWHRSHLCSSVWADGVFRFLRQHVLGALFVIEIFGGGFVPLILLARESLRQRTAFLFTGALLTTMGVILNRVNVVVLAMDLRGAMPQNAPETYAPSIFEWGISIGLIAATIFLFGLGARLFPLLPKEEEP